ncbi:hypothetical protein ACSQ67_025967 [Phaseolus vulgaris]
MSASNGNNGVRVERRELAAPKNLMEVIIILAEAIMLFCYTERRHMFNLPRAIAHAVLDKGKKTIGSECRERSDCVELKGSQILKELHELKRMLTCAKIFSCCKRSLAFLFAAGFEEEDILCRKRTARAHSIIGSGWPGMIAGNVLDTFSGLGQTKQANEINSSSSRINVVDASADIPKPYMKIYGSVTRKLFRINSSWYEGSWTIRRKRNGSEIIDGAMDANNLATVAASEVVHHKEFNETPQPLPKGNVLSYEAFRCCTVSYDARDNVSLLLKEMRWMNGKQNLGIKTNLKTVNNNKEERYCGDRVIEEDWLGLLGRLFGTFSSVSGAQL